MHPAIKKLKEYTLPILLFLGLLLVGIYYYFKLFENATFNANESGFKEIFGFGLTILGSGIFLAVLKWFQFMDFFQQELHRIISSSEFDKKLEKTVEDVLYSDAFLKKHTETDLIALWSRVNKALFNNQFSEDLAAKIELQMQNIFIHNSKLSHYYKTFLYRVNVSIDEKDFLTIKVITEAKIIRQDKSRFRYDLQYYSLKMDAQDKTTAVNFNSIIIDGQSQDRAKITLVTDDESRIARKFETDLEGKIEYPLYLDLTLIYNINRDFEFSLFCERFVDYLRAEIDFQPSVRPIFLPLGNEPFETIPSTSDKIIRVYNGMLFPEKGFRVIFIKNQAF